MQAPKATMTVAAFACFLATASVAAPAGPSRPSRPPVGSRVAAAVAPLEGLQWPRHGRLSPAGRVSYYQRVVKHDRDVLGFVASHRELAGVNRVARTARAQLRWARSLLASAQAGLLPAHAALWLCIHGDPRYRSDGGEGGWHDHDSGGNGHYGGLQMHPAWGYGTSYLADADSPLVQMRAAENGYRASGYSRAWLAGQWGQTIGPCWRYA